MEPIITLILARLKCWRIFSMEKKLGQIQKSRWILRECWISANVSILHSIRISNDQHFIELFDPQKKKIPKIKNPDSGSWFRILIPIMAPVGTGGANQSCANPFASRTGIAGTVPQSHRRRRIDQGSRRSFLVLLADGARLRTAARIPHPQLVHLLQVNHQLPSIIPFLSRIEWLLPLQRRFQTPSALNTANYLAEISQSTCKIGN